MEQKFSNGTHHLQDLDGKSHKRRINGIRLKKYIARLMVAYKESDREEEELNEDVKDSGERNLDISNLFNELLDMNVSADKWGC